MTPRRFRCNRDCGCARRTNHYDWSGNTGWIDFRPERPNAGDGASTVQAIEAGAPQAFFHVGVKLPLQP